MTRSVAAILVFASVVVSGAANAEELNAGQLYAFCTSQNEVASTACSFFILGVVQGIGLGDGALMGPNGRIKPRGRTHFCIPERVPQDRMVSIFQNTIRVLVDGDPEDLNAPA